MGKDLELEDGEMGITSVEDGETYDEEIAYSTLPEKTGTRNLILYGAVALFLVLAVFAAYKKVQTR